MPSSPSRKQKQKYSKKSVGKDTKAERGEVNDKGRARKPGTLVEASSPHPKQKKKVVCCPRVIRGAPRCGTGALLRSYAPCTQPSAYKNHGMTSDDPKLTPRGLPNPYSDLMKQLHLQELYGMLNIPILGEEQNISGNGLVMSNMASAAKSATQVGAEGSGVDDDDDEEDDDEDDEDEKGLPNAVCMSDPHRKIKSTNEVLKESHKRLMEDIARSVEPENLMSHLHSLGYFKFSYRDHARTTWDNQHLINGKKKSVERLYSLIGKRITNVLE